MASFHESKAARTVQTKAVVARAKARAPPPGPLILAAVLSLACFLVSDYLLFDDTPCDVDFSPQTFLQSHCQLARGQPGAVHELRFFSTHAHIPPQYGRHRTGGYTLPSQGFY
jgi:hypothetical protein